MLRTRVAMFAAALAVGTALPAAAQGGNGTRKDRPREGREHAVVRVSDVEIRVIREYYVKKGNGRAKGLPPGIAKKISRGKPLPPGLARSRMPDDLVLTLRTRPNYEWVVTGNVVVLVDPVGLVVDVIDAVL